jgi:hypothetical protein
LDESALDTEEEVGDTLGEVELLEGFWVGIPCNKIACLRGNNEVDARLLDVLNEGEVKALVLAPWHTPIVEQDSMYTRSCFATSLSEIDAI